MYEKRLEYQRAACVVSLDETRLREDYCNGKCNQICYVRSVLSGTEKRVGF